MRGRCRAPIILVLALLAAACTGAAPPSATAPPPLPSYELEVRPDPPGAAEFLLIPNPPKDGLGDSP